MATTPNNFSATWHQSIADAQATCTWPWVYDYEKSLPGTSLNVHQIFMIVVGAAAAVNILISTYLFISHVCNWTRPLEQKQYTRIILFPIVLSLTSFFAVMKYHTSDQVWPIGELYEGVAIVAIFMLYIQIIAPNERLGAAMYEIESNTDPRARRNWKSVFQIVPVRIICFIAYEAVFGASCPMSKHRKTGKTIITIVEAISTVMAIASVIGFERRNKQNLAGHKPLLKLAAFKGVIGLQVIQNIAFSALAQDDAFMPSAPYHLSYNDWVNGLPQVLFSWELVGASVIFLWAFESSRFRKDATRTSGPFGAILATINPLDIIQGIAYSFMGSRPSNDVVYADKYGRSESPEV